MRVDQKTAGTLTGTSATKCSCRGAPTFRWKRNGGISIADVSGRIDFSALNGGVVLKRVGGAVRGSTTNGGLVIELTGDRWDGDSLDVSTTNGGIICRSRKTTPHIFRLER